MIFWAMVAAFHPRNPFDARLLWNIIEDEYPRWKVTP